MSKTETLDKKKTLTLKTISVREITGRMKAEKSTPGKKFPGITTKVEPKVLKRIYINRDALMGWSDRPIFEVKINGRPDVRLKSVTILGETTVVADKGVPSCGLRSKQGRAWLETSDAVTGIDASGKRVIL